MEDGAMVSEGAKFCVRWGFWTAYFGSLGLGFALWGWVAMWGLVIVAGVTLCAAGYVLERRAR